MHVSYTRVPSTRPSASFLSGPGTRLGRTTTTVPGARLTRRCCRPMQHGPRSCRVACRCGIRQWLVSDRASERRAALRTRACEHIRSSCARACACVCVRAAGARVAEGLCMRQCPARQVAHHSPPGSLYALEAASRCTHYAMRHGTMHSTIPHGTQSRLFFVVCYHHCCQRCCFISAVVVVIAIVIVNFIVIVVVIIVVVDSCPTS